MPEILTTFQLVVLGGLGAAFFYFWGLSIAGTFQSDMHKFQKNIRAAGYMAILAVTFFLRCIATNNDFNPFSLLW